MVRPSTQAIKQIYFQDIFADNGKEVKTPPHTTYTRLQKAGSPIVFASYFKYEQKDIKGKGIAGSDDHLLKAVLRDTTGVSYLPTPLIYDKTSGGPQSGIAVILWISMETIGSARMKRSLRQVVECH